MVNMAVAYAGPSPALVALTTKLRRVYGNPSRTFEFVTGYKAPGNITSHNADANGRVHAVDIFVGPGNLTEAQGIDLAERLRSEGKRGKIPGHPDRLAYIIHRGQIAGDHTDWEWITYTGKDWHGDHIHVSTVFDYYWGDNIPGNPADYNSTADWDLWETEFQPAAPQSDSITPIPSEEDDMFDNKDRANLETALGKVLTLVGMLDNVAASVNQVPGKTLAKPVPRSGGKGETSLGLFLSYSDADRAATVNSIKAGIAALPATDIAAAIPEGLAAQVADELAKRLAK